MMGMSGYELAIVAGVFVLLFSPGMIARRCRALGETIAEMRKLRGETDHDDS